HLGAIRIAAVCVDASILLARDRPATCAGTFVQFHALEEVPLNVAPLHVSLGKQATSSRFLPLAPRFHLCDGANLVPSLRACNRLLRERWSAIRTCAQWPM